MERNVFLTLAGILMGIAIAVLWFPAPRPPARVEHDVEMPSAVILEVVPPGHRGVLRRPDGAPAGGVDVYLTEILPNLRRIYPVTRTNHVGHFPLRVPPGLYRVQALDGFDKALDYVIAVGAEPSPDIEVHLQTVPLFHFIARE